MHPAMTFLAIDHSQVRSEDGLYTGEEVCAMLCENDAILAGIEQVGVEMELDESLIPTDVSCIEDGASKEDEKPQHDEEEPAAPCSNDNDDPFVKCAVDCSTAAIATIATIADADVGGGGRAAVNAANKRGSLGRKLYHIRRQVLNKATSKLMSMTKLRGPDGPTSTSMSSPKARRALKMASDNSTCAMTHASNSSSIASRDISGDGEDCANDGRTLGNTNSSITASTCDFAPDLNHHAVFESYLVTNPWEAAKRGDYATLSYIANHDDANIWTQEDEFGNVPLYYACTSYSRADGLSFGKYGLESVKLLIRVWPSDVELPWALLERCTGNSSSSDFSSSNNSEQEGTAIHMDVVEVLSRSKNSNGQLPPPFAASIRANLSLISEESDNVRIEGVSDVVPVSFLEDLGDDGYVEDY